MSKAERKSDEIRETWKIVTLRQRGRCCLCEKPIRQLAHVVGQGDRNIEKYGLEVIHHPDNIRGVCGLAHNSAVSLNPDTQPVSVARHIERIRKKIMEEEQWKKLL